MGTLSNSLHDQDVRTVGTPVNAAFDRRAFELSASGVSWAAVIAGAFVSAALALILMALGSGLGLMSVSPWPSEGASTKTVTALAIVWLTFVQIAASAIGGYLTGRLRTKWASVHNDEVYFRDTANGLTMWAVGMVMTVVFLTTTATFMAGSATVGATTGAAAAGTTAAATSPTDTSPYFTDMLFRSDPGAAGNAAANANGQTAASNVAASNAEAGRIFANAMRQGDMTQADRQYLARMISARTGISQQEADRRITEVMTEARQAADAARKASAYFLLWVFIMLCAGAFCASYFATIGGRIRDNVKHATA